MSTRKWQFRLRDMLESSRKIQSYIHGLSFDDFCDDEKTMDAVIRQLTVIGEASAHIPQEVAAAHPEIPWDVIRGMRNVIVHEYFGVNIRIVWTTANKNIPELHNQLEKLVQTLAKKNG
ncbi:MAG: DUF86 domain-containing protein [Desulfonatronovibrionaceae bacterium]